MGAGLVSLWVQFCDPSPIPTILQEKFILMANLHMVKVQSLSQNLLECKHNFSIIGLIKTNHTKNILIYVNVNYHTAGVQWFNSILQEEYNIL